MRRRIQQKGGLDGANFRYRRPKSDRLPGAGHPPSSRHTGIRAAAETLLSEGEALSSFVEQSIRDNVEHRRARQASLAGGMASREEALRTGEYFRAEQIHSELDALLRGAGVKPWSVHYCC